MKIRTTRVVSLLLVFILISLFLAGCSPRELFIYVKKGQSPGVFTSLVQAKIEADGYVFDKNKVDLDFFYGLYCLDNSSLEECKDSHNYTPPQNEIDKGYSYYEFVYAIYISKNDELVLERKEADYVTDYKNKVNAQLYKFISYEEAFNTNYGWHGEVDFSRVYNYSEKLHIPANLFDSSSGHIYIYLIWMNYYPDKEEYRLPYSQRIYSIDISYSMIGDNIVVLTK